MTDQHIAFQGEVWHEISFHWPVRRSGIYLIANKVNGKVYVGSAANFKARWKRHRVDLKAGVHHSLPLQRAWKKYGHEAFAFLVHSFVGERALLTEFEQLVIDRLKASKPEFGYNVCKTAGSTLGVKHRPEVGMARGIKMRGDQHPMHGRTHSDAAKAKMSTTRRGKPTGVIYTDEIRARISASAKGRVISDEQREKIRQSLKGRKRSPEAVEKSAAGHRGRIASDETRMRQSIGIKLARANGANVGGRKRVPT